MKAIGDEDIQIVAPQTLEKKGVTTSKKPQKKNVKDVEEDEESGSKNWKDCDVQTIISLHNKMEPYFWRTQRNKIKFHISKKF